MHSRPIKIAIAGPGRSGSSVLVKLFAGWGFSTVPESQDDWHPEAQAGLESRIDGLSPYEVDKDPWAYEYLPRVDAGVLQGYDALIIPLRDRLDAAVSRSVQERVHRARFADDDRWLWNTWGAAPGGAVMPSDLGSISNTLSAGLWDLLVAAGAAGMAPRILHFPRFVADFDYLWGQLGDLISRRCDRSRAQQVWADVANPERIRIRSTDTDRDAQVEELTATITSLIDQLRAAESLAEERRQANDVLASELAQIREQIGEGIDRPQRGSRWRRSGP